MTAQRAVSAAKGEIERDHYGRPLIAPPGGGKPKPYTRVTTFAGTLEDNYALGRWQMRQTMIGLIERPDLALSVAAHREESKELDAIADAAMEAARARASAVVGTALHALCERIDLGLDPGPVPGDYQRDLDAYVRTTRPLNVLAAERFVVLDDLAIAGTFDRLVEFRGGTYVADIKTGSISGALKIACQLALYAHGALYDPRTAERTPLPADLDRDRGIVIHLPAGTGTASLHWVDLAAGWDAVRTAYDVRAWRKRYRELLDPISLDDGLEVLAGAGFDVDPVLAAIDLATSLDDLTETWSRNRDRWNATHTAAAATRKAQLSGGST